MQFELVWIVQFILLPVIGALFWLTFKHRAECEARDGSLEKKVEDHRRALDMQLLSLQMDLSQFKLAVAKEYATNGYMKDVEMRVVAALEKLAGKVDKIHEWMVNNK